MTGEKFTLLQYPISGILGLIETEQFVIPEIQRPFVWKRSQVRDLIDSLYNGYPTGYIITWKNPDVKTKDGGVSNGKHVLIDPDSGEIKSGSLKGTNIKNLKQNANPKRQKALKNAFSHSSCTDASLNKTFAPDSPMGKEIDNYCCPKCGSEFIDEFDCKDAEINLEDDTVYLRQAMTCRDCGEEFTMVTTGDITNLKFSAY